jgi:hypothetical protein
MLSVNLGNFTRSKEQLLTNKKASVDDNLRTLLEKYGETRLTNMLEELKISDEVKKVNNSIPKLVVRKPTYLQDAVHGQVHIDQRLFCFIDTPEFQRLRWIRQLGTNFWVYPSACHSRFSHSIGTYHIARTLLYRIYQEQRPQNLTERMIFLITSAALVHDIGHGPFSHDFERVLHCLFPGQIIPDHEEMGGKILDAMWEKYEAVRKEYSKEDLRLIKVLLEPQLLDFIEYSNLKKHYRELGLL